MAKHWKILWLEGPDSYVLSGDAEEDVFNRFGSLLKGQALHKMLLKDWEISQEFLSKSHYLVLHREKADPSQEEAPSAVNREKIVKIMCLQRDKVFHMNGDTEKTSLSQMLCEGWAPKEFFKVEPGSAYLLLEKNK